MDRATLRGLKAVKVVINPVPPELERQGVDSGALRAGVTQKLRDSGITIDDDATAFLGVELSSLKASRWSTMPVAVAVELYQVVILSRDKNVKTVAETWGDRRLMAAGAKALDHAISDTVGQLVDQFIQAYRSVNPQ